ncbi:MAG: nicotinamide riboside transporter PnuC [Saprospiraceae bacterium]
MDLSLLTILEIIATICGLIHVFLLTREKIIAWPFGIATVTIYVYIFFASRLYSDAILHVCYIAINSYGWYNWARRKENVTEVKISRLRPSGIAILAAIVFAGTLAWGYLMDTNTDASFAYYDAFTTVASFTAQYLLTQKKIDNWAVWIAVDLVAIPIYLLKGLYVTSGLYFVYLLLCISGLIEWRKTFQLQPADR